MSPSSWASTVFDLVRRVSGVSATCAADGTIDNKAAMIAAQNLSRMGGSPRLAATRRFVHIVVVTLRVTPITRSVMTTMCSRQYRPRDGALPEADTTVGYGHGNSELVGSATQRSEC